MTDEALKAISLFYFFAFLDENMATDASMKTASKLRALLSKVDNPAREKIQSHIVHLTRKYYEAHRRTIGRGHSMISFEGGWLLPNLDLSAWKQFQKESGENELMAVIWSKVLCFSDEAISEGLGVTVGTVRYRVGNGLRALGALSKFKALTKA